MNVPTSTESIYETKIYETEQQSNSPIYEEIGKIESKADDEYYQGLKEGGFHWNPESTRLMLIERFKRHQEFVEPTQPKINIWKEIAQVMRENGFQIDGYLCNLKFRNLMQTYRSNRQKEINGQEWQINWEHYEMFKEHLEQKPEPVDSMPFETVTFRTQHTIAAAESTDTGSSKYVISHLDDNDDDKYDAYGSPASYGRNNNNNNLTTYLPGMEVANESSSLSMEPMHKRMRYSSNGSCSPPSNMLTPEVSLQIGNEIPPTKHTTTNATDFKTGFFPEEQRQRIAILNECRIFGESVGYQLSTVKDLKDRALTQFKIQEVIYKAKIGILKE